MTPVWALRGDRGGESDRLFRLSTYGFPIPLNTFRSSKSNDKGDIKQNPKLATYDPSLSLSLHTHVCGLRTTYSNEFSDAIYLCLGVHIYPAPICDIRHLICDSDFSGLGGKKSDSDIRFFTFWQYFYTLDLLTAYISYKESHITPNKPDPWVDYVFSDILNTLQNDRLLHM